MCSRIRMYSENNTIILLYNNHNHNNVINYNFGVEGGVGTMVAGGRGSWTLGEGSLEFPQS